MSKPIIPASTFAFLKKIMKNNNREWFNAHKEEFIQQQTLIENFAEALLQELNKHDVIETPSGKKACYRIYRDVRFSKDKTPYNTYFSGSYRRATKYRRGGLYFHLEPGNSWLAGGFWGPNSEDLKRIREDIAFDERPLRKIINSKTFVASFGTLRGEQLKTIPKGFDAAHPGIDLLRYKQFLLVRKFSDEEVLGSDFLKLANQTFKNMRPFFDYMSEVLTTDINGEEV
ncbi:MAG: DUF2461 domain-containing protein [Chitinophagales bacterium]|nr:DUF2461 domain-containing protein [Chitinophagales bacterium]